jgi:hypothetical protein
VLALIGGALILLGGGSGADLALARAINLKPSDLPGFTVQPPDHGSSSSDKIINARMKNCLGPIAVPDHGGASAQSPTLTSGSGLQVVSVQSQVGILSSKAGVASDFAFIARNPQVWTCLSSAMSGLSATSNGVTVTFNNVHATPLAASARGADMATGVRLVMTLSARGLSFPMVFDLLAYGVGRDELSFYTITLGADASTLEQQVAGDMIARALAHPH